MRTRATWSCRAAVLAALSVAALWPAPVSATVAIRLRLPRMVQSADLVVEGTVASFDLRRGTTAQGELCPALDLPYTDVTLDVSEVYKGRISNPRLIVRVFGGRVERGGILRDTYLPFRRGERVLLFLQMNGKDDFPFVGFHQGIHRFRLSGPNHTMPNVDDVKPAGACQRCSPIVLDGRDLLVTGFDARGFLETLPVSLLPAFHVVVGPGENTPAEPKVPSGGVIPPGVKLPRTAATPAMVREAIRDVLRALGLPAPSPLGDPSAPLAAELHPGDPIVRCGTHALLSDEPEAFEPVPGRPDDAPIVPGPSEPRHQGRR